MALHSDLVADQHLRGGLLSAKPETSGSIKHSAALFKRGRCAGSRSPLPAQPSGLRPVRVKWINDLKDEERPIDGPDAFPTALDPHSYPR